MRHDGGDSLQSQDHCEGLRALPLNWVECSFSGRSLGPCLPQFWHPLRYRQLPSVRHGVPWSRPKSTMVADAVIKAPTAKLIALSVSNPLDRGPCRRPPRAAVLQGQLREHRTLLALTEFVKSLFFQLPHPFTANAEAVTNFLQTLRLVRV